MSGRPVASSLVPYLLLAWLAGAFVAGVATSATFGAGAWPAAVAVGATCAAVGVARKRRLWAAYAVVLPAVFLAGVAREQAGRPALAADDAVVHAGASRLIRGVVRDDPEIGDTSQRFAIDVRAVQRAGT